MKTLKHLFDNNRHWAAERQHEDPHFFEKLSTLQTPEYLWIGCSDSRVPANQITGLLPGEVFVHRNIANIVGRSDLNCLSVVQFAVDVLKVKHIIVCGHYGCGGVHAALTGRKLGMADEWIKPISDIRQKHQALFNRLEEAKAWDLLCELNVVTQCVNVAQTPILRGAWNRGQEVTLHGWCYGLKNGLLNDLNMNISRYEEVEPTFSAALERYITLTP